MNELDWRLVFAGRESELEALKASWQKVKSGNGPHLHVVRAERGMGKTRLVQELYRYLSSHEDPDDYWPDGLSFIGKALLPGPDPRIDPVAKSHFDGFTLKDRPMPFLWWGLRLADPWQRNAIRSGLRDHMQSLDPHLQNAEYAKAWKALDKGLLELAKDTAQDEGIELTAEIIASAIPFASLVVKVLKAGVGVLKNRKKRQELAADFAQQTIKSIAVKDDDSLNEIALNKIRMVLKEQSKDAFLPVILFVDDAQFASKAGDSGTLRFLGDIWSYATGLKLPLLLIATHWDAEWQSGMENPDEICFAAHFSPDQANIKDRFSQSVLTSDVELLAMVQAGLPDLLPDDHALLLKKSDGNPQLLFELIDKVRRSRAWVERASGKLSDSGRQAIRTGVFDTHSLIVERLDDPERTPVAVRDAVVLGSTIGMEFMQNIIMLAAEKLKLDLSQTALSDADTPHRFINLQEGGLAAFIQRAARDAAHSLSEQYIGPKADIDAALAQAAETLAQDDTAPQAERMTARGLQIGLGEHSDDPAKRLVAAKA
ncbi:MAG: ATP-binding protein, partial [Robiginitomaculum sp.]|nr:ATP-binding protein [Robiginitomaculum sp.]